MKTCIQCILSAQPVDFTLNLRCYKTPFSAYGARFVQLLCTRDQTRMTEFMELPEGNAMMETTTDNQKDPTVHLYRGAPPVRSWSKYQTTVQGWTLCGINRRLASGPSVRRAHCFEGAEGVSLPPLPHPDAS